MTVGRAERDSVRRVQSLLSVTESIEEAGSRVGGGRGVSFADFTFRPEVKFDRGGLFSARAYLTGTPRPCEAGLGLELHAPRGQRIGCPAPHPLVSWVEEADVPAGI